MSLFLNTLPFFSSNGQPSPHKSEKRRFFSKSNFHLSPKCLSPQPLYLQVEIPAPARVTIFLHLPLLIYCAIPLKLTSSKRLLPCGSSLFLCKDPASISSIPTEISKMPSDVAKIDYMTKRLLLYKTCLLK